ITGQIEQEPLASHQWDIETDVGVTGSGAAGFAAGALRAPKQQYPEQLETELIEVGGPQSAFPSANLVAVRSLSLQQPAELRNGPIPNRKQFFISACWRRAIGRAAALDG